MLKWEATPSTYRFADCEFGRYQIIGRGGRRLRVTDPVGCVLIHHEHRSIADAKAWAEADYAARVGRIAAANGYVKLEPGQVVVQVEDLTRIVTWFKGDARTVPHADMDTTLNRFAAAIDAAKGETK
jgi:hypothetical protein